MGLKTVYVDYLHKSYFATQRMLTINGKYAQATTAAKSILHQAQVSQQKVKIVNNFHLTDLAT